jgi:hypothetical protein
MAQPFDGKQVIPLSTEEGGYREWNISLDGIDYAVFINDDEDESKEDGWRMLKWVQHDGAEDEEWIEVASGSAVALFLEQHNLILGQ